MQTSPSQKPISNTQPVPTAPAKKRANKKQIFYRWLMGIFLILVVIGILSLSALTGGVFGYTKGQSLRQVQGLAQDQKSIDEQYQIGLQDFQNGNLDVARQRFEWILSQDPTYPGAVEILTQITSILFATATPTPVPPSPTPTATPDLRPVQDLFTQAQELFSLDDWQGVLDTLTNLRHSDPEYMVVEVDRLLYLSLRNLGRMKILQLGDLEGGIYDLTLAEKFGPLDVDAQSAREWARLYLIGSSFWEAVPEQAVYFFRQVVAALPSLRDASGWTAKERLHESLIQWGDQLMAREEWCEAQSRYQEAYDLISDAQLAELLEQATNKCTPPTEEPSATPSETPTPTATVTLEVIFDTPTTQWTDTATVEPTPVPSETPTITPPSPASETPTPTETPVVPDASPTATPGSGINSSLIGRMVSLSLSSFFLLGTLISPKLAEPIKNPSKKPVNKKSRRRRMVIITLIIGMIVILALALAIIGYLVGKELALFGSGNNNQPEPQITINAQGTPVNPQGTPISTASIPSQQDPVLLELTPWDGAGRVTVLLLGLDYRDWEKGEKYSRSDTMILLTLDPLTKTAGILSIPRDMWVGIPGFQHGKINTAYYLGDAYKLPGGGPALAVKTVESFIGVPINYYAQVDFQSFVRIIDEIGGIKIDIPKKITIDLEGTGPKTKKVLKPGEQVLPGAYALAYARNRYSEGGDFDRAERQQQVIMAIKRRITEFDLLPMLIAKSPKLYEELSSGIRTNLSLDQAIQLAALAKSIPDENIERGVLGKGFILFATSPDGLSILIPLPDKIHEMRDDIFASTGVLNPGTPGDSQQKMQAEGSKLTILNGSGITDLEARVSTWLSESGAIIGQTGQADQIYPYTTIIDHTGNPFTVKYLVDTLGINPYRILSEFDPNSATDVELILGRDASDKIP
jgi:LCP family protein required for cell wall assembly